MKEMQRLDLTGMKHTDEFPGLFYETSSGMFFRDGKRAGHKHSSGYRYLCYKRTQYREHTLAWFFLKRVWPKDQIDHVNGIKDDNREWNLREATNSQNQMNSPIYKTSTTGFKGVSKKGNKFQSQIGINGKNYYLGLYDSLEEAVEVRKRKEEEVFGEFMRK